LLNRLQEIQRGDGKHGSTGLGVGIAAMEALLNIHILLPESETILCLKIGDMVDPKSFSEKMSNIYFQKMQQINAVLNDKSNSAEISERLQKRLKEFEEERSLESVTGEYTEFGKIMKEQFVDGQKFLGQFIEDSKNVVFEGAQGALLDTEYGFYPHVTATACTTQNAMTLLDELKDTHEFDCQTVGVLRTYFHRHGVGPFVTEVMDKGFLASVPELHNVKNLWQDHFRVGDLDLIALQHGLNLSSIDSLSVTHLDYIPKNGDWKIVLSYEYGGNKSTEYLDKYFVWEKNGEKIRVLGLKIHRESTELTNLLLECLPSETINLTDLGEGDATNRFLFFLAEKLHKKVFIASYGPTASDKKIINLEVIHKDEFIN